MSVCIVTVVALPVGINLLSGAVLAAATAAAAAFNLFPEDQAGVTSAALENSVDLCLDNASEVGGDLNLGQSLTFSGDGVKVIFFQNEAGEMAVRVSGRKSKAELKALGEAMSRKLIQQYAYHRLVTEMKARNMNIVEEDVETDGTVRLRVRVVQG